MINGDTIETQIIANATDLFLTKGFKSVTMDDLASSLGMSKKTIYSYFETKNLLVNAVTDYLFDIISTGINYIRSQNYNSIEELFLVNDFVQKHLKNENSSPLYQLQKYYPKIHSQLIKKQFEVTTQCVIHNLEKGIEEGLYRKSLNKEFISRIYFSLIVGIKDQEMFPKEVFPVKATVTNFLDYHIHGITNAKGLKILEQIQQTRK